MPTDPDDDRPPRGHLPPVPGLDELDRRLADVGTFIRSQRETASMSVRRLAELAGVSNPYLSQIERGLRKPSADILQQIAKALRISAEQLYVRAGIVGLDESGSVELAILADTGLTERQKQSLLDVYSSFLATNAIDEAGEQTEND